MIAVDFETYLISAEEPIPRPVCLSYYDGTNSGVVVGSKMEQVLRSFLESHELIIAHNMSFEFNVIDTHYPQLRPLLYSKLKKKHLICTKIYEQLLDCQRKKSIMMFSLAKLVDAYFKVDISEDKKKPDAWRLRYHELVGVPVEEWDPEAVRYAIDDSIWAYKVYQKQQQSMFLDISGSVMADCYLNKMGLLGTTIDKDRVLLIESELKAQIDEHVTVLETAGLLQKKAGKYKKSMGLFRKMLEAEIPTIRKTPKGVVSTSNEDIDYYLEVVDPESDLKKILTSFVEVMNAEKVLTAFVSRLKEAHPLIRTQYKAVVSSGRTSSSSSTNFPSVNMQQMPREVKGTTWDIRNCFVPRPGFQICSIDYAGLELTSAAHQLHAITPTMGDMLLTINKGDKPIDMHSMLAYKLMNMKEKTKETYETFVEHKKEPRYKAYRQMAKPINLGFPGGIGYDTMRSLLAKENVYPKLEVVDFAKYEEPLSLKRSIARGQGYPVRIRRVAYDRFELVYDELVAFKDQMFGLYPDLEFFLKEGHKKFLTGETKMLKNEYGEWEQEDMYRFEIGGFKRDWCQYTQLCNGMLMQSPSATGAKRAVSKFMQEFGNLDIVKPMAFIHDEILFEIKECPQMYGLIQDVSEIMIDEMQSVLTSVRVAVEAELFPHWAKTGSTWSLQYWKDPKNKTLRSM